MARSARLDTGSTQLLKKKLKKIEYGTQRAPWHTG
jgi:hypothetical protein